MVVALLAVGCTSQPTAGASPGPAFNATDTAWILLMIPMTERAQLLTDLAPSRTADPSLAKLAAKTGSTLRGDLRRLRAVLRLSGVPDTHPHEGHNMPGMVSLATLEKAAATNGQAFDRILSDALRAGFTQSRLLCAGEQTHGQADEARELAAAIARSTAEQSSQLDKLRAAQPATSGDETTRDNGITAIEAGQAESVWAAKQLGRPIVKAWHSIAPSRSRTGSSRREVRTASRSRRGRQHARA
ncbi:DUF305 domain-containing protein [Streptomyces sp. NBC_01520]|uniref:DUF305 domain-containing protein n=1 Tax=Streptomyces sp. NBC_01520 TaxID=2903892 RepID=UPI00386DCA8E